MSENYNIDFVIPWVDGADSEWRQKKQEYLSKESHKDIDAADERYRDWDQLKYWFRSVEKFAPWVNRIFFITCGQKPEWLNTEHPKLVCVKHEDYIPKEYLPVFSSHPIELNMHRIQGLSEHFVYFNDDMFFTAPVTEEDFFKSGLPCGLAVESPVTPDSRDIFHHILLNNIAYINETYSRKDVLKKYRKKFYSWIDKKGLIMNLALSILHRDDFFGFEYNHLPSCFLKSSLESTWEKNPNWLDLTCRHRFRNIEDINQYVFLYYQYVNGLFTPDNWRKKGKAFHVNDECPGMVEEICTAVKDGSYKYVCINEARVCHFEETKEKINRALETRFPEKSLYEQ